MVMVCGGWMVGGDMPVVGGMGFAIGFCKDMCGSIAIEEWEVPITSIILT